MEHMPKNGYFLQRRKMFVDAPFHNRYSNLPLNWKGEEATTEELERHRRRQQEERERTRQAYEMSVDQRMNKRYLNYDHSNVQNEKFKRRNEDILTKQLEMFNQSKVILAHQIPESRVRYDKETIQHEEYPDKGQAYMKTSHTKRENNQSNRNDDYRNQGQLDPRTNPEQSYRPNPEQSYRASREKPALQSSTINYQLSPAEYGKYQEEDNRLRQHSPVSDRYRSMESPYSHRDLGKEIEQLYTGTKPEDYPFRNVIPDKLQSYLREDTKADRRRSYQVSLNLFKK